MNSESAAPANPAGEFVPEHLPSADRRAQLIGVLERAPQELHRAVLGDALAYYAWHSRHHTEQLTWLRSHHGW